MQVFLTMWWKCEEILMSF